MIEIDLQPDTRKLRQFGWICLGGFGLLGLIVALKTGAFQEIGKWTVPVALWVLATAAPVMGFVAPKGLKPVYQLLTLLSYPIGQLIGNLLLLLIFLLLFTPVALWFRIIRRDELKIRRPSAFPPSWMSYPDPRGMDSYFRQF